MEIINSKNEIKIILETDEECAKVPVALIRMQEIILWGLGSVKICLNTKKDGSKHIFVSQTREDK